MPALDQRHQQDVSLAFTPWPKQARASMSSARYKTCGGGRGGGKSAWIAGECWDLLVSYPGNVGFLGRADLEDLRRSALKEFFAQDKDAGLIIQHHQTQMWIDVETCDPNHPSRLYYGELKDPTSQLGVNLGFFGVDEGYEIPRQSWDNLAGNLRHHLPDGTFPPFFGFCTTNPAPCWIQDLFPVSREQQRDVREGRWPNARYAYFPFLASDNPANPPDYMDNLREIYANDPVGYNRMVLGLWDNMLSGLVYPFARHHRWKAREPGLRLWRPGVPVSLAIDPSGGAAPYAIAAIQEVGPYICVIDEFYGQGPQASDEAAIDWLHSRPYARDVGDSICDPAAKSSIDRLRANGLEVRGLSRPKDIRGQILGVKGIMRQNPQTGFAPLLVDENYCVNTVLEFGSYAYKTLREVDRLAGKHPTELPEDRNNHIINAIEYWVREKRPTGDAPMHARKAPEREVASYYQLVGA
jgi:hypothetical protein